MNCSVRLVLNPGFPIDPADLALPEQANPSLEQPSRHERARQNVEQLPRDERERPPGCSSVDRLVGESEKPIMNRADEKKPAEAEKMPPNELPVGTEGIAQAFV